MTDTNGVANLTGVPTTDNVAHTAAVVASFAGDSNYNAAADGTGVLVVSPADTSLGTVSGTAIYGGTATLVATLTSTVTNLGIPGETVTFMLDGMPVGMATTDSNGVATLTGVPTTNVAGTDTGGVVAMFAGDTNYNPATDVSGDLVVSRADTTLATVSGSGSVSGGSVTLLATLTSQVTGMGISGETVNFTVNGTFMGTAVTDSNGVATLVETSYIPAMGDYPGGVVASYAGTINYVAATDATGDLTMSA